MPDPLRTPDDGRWARQLFTSALRAALLGAGVLLIASALGFAQASALGMGAGVIGLAVFTAPYLIEGGE